MSEETEIKKSDSVKPDGKPTILFWLVSILAVIWSIFGLMDFYFISTGNEKYLAALPPKFKYLIDSFPLWRKILWGFSGGAAFLGGVLMLLRSAWAVPVLWLVPITMIIGFIGHDLLLSNGIEAYGTFGLITSTIMILISLILALYAAGCDEDDILK